MKIKATGRKRVAFHTLGCKVNQNETEALSALFQERGYEIVAFEDEADFYVINTCTVTHLADRKSRQMIRRAAKTNPQADIVVTGCYAQTDAEAVQKIPGVSLIVGTNEKAHLVDLVEELQAKPKSEDHETNEARPKNRVKVFVRKYQELKDFEEFKVDKDVQRARAYLKVQEGCNQFCSYCIIPYARGPVRSRTLQNTLEEAEKLIRHGFKEIVLTGIHLGAYGLDLGKKQNLVSLLQKLLALNPKVRWRLSSLEPTEVTGGLIKLLKDYANFCPHLHLPLQSGHDEILKAMHRPYTTAQYLETIRKIRKAVPDIAISTDLMVGFPGEKEEHFREYMEFVEQVGFSRLHVFKYSPRQGTPAAKYPDQVPPPVKEARSRKLIRLGNKLEERYTKKFLYRVVDVLAEEQLDDSTWEGSSANYLKVRFKGTSVVRGEIIPVILQELTEGYCLGDVYQLK
jgi:threonylcarbamoyladenosine tRNA methylthiotransferase MtaB